jgi:hypothetical protein
MALASGTWIGNYDVVSSLGAGGMGEAYRARDGAAEAVEGARARGPGGRRRHPIGADRARWEVVRHSYTRQTEDLYLADGLK